MTLYKARILSLLALALTAGLSLLNEMLLKGKGGTLMQVAVDVPLFVMPWAYGKVKPNPPMKRKRKTIDNTKE